MDQPESHQEIVAQYHLHTEAKVHNGDHLNNGVTPRSHIVATAVEHIGKGNKLHMEIIDDGVGLPLDRHAGVGLTSMRERAEELGGSCVIESMPTGGTHVLVRLPLPPSEE